MVSTGANPVAGEAEQMGKPAIPDHDRVLRRLSDSGPNMIAVDVLTGDRRPSSGAFKPDEDGLSVFREAVLDEAQMTAADVAVSPQNLVVALSIAEVRSIAPLDVRDDPWPIDVPDPAHPRYAAHALITGWDGLGKGERLRRQKQLSRLPSLAFIHP